MTNKEIIKLGKEAYQHYGMCYNTPALSKSEMDEHLYVQGFKWGYNTLLKENEKLKKEIAKFDSKIDTLMDFISEHDLDEVEELLNKIDEEEDD